MGLEELKKEILSKAKDQAKDTLKEAKSQEKKILKSAEDRLKEYKSIAEEDLKKVEELLEKRIKASAELESKKMELEAKKELTDEVFKDVIDNIKKLSDSKRKDHIKKLIKKASKEIDIETIYCNKKDKNLVEGFNVVEQGMLGGIIAENKEKTFLIDYSYDSLLDEIKEKNMLDIAKKLFK